MNHPEELGKIISKAENWWENNCLYLDTKSSNTFHAALIGTTMLEATVGDVKTRKDIFDTIYKVGEHLSKGIGLPHLDDKATLYKRIFGKEDKD
jgi:hypothetical protein